MEMHNGDLGDNVSSPFAEIGVTEKAVGLQGSEVR
jgi:hypothetical protein